MQRVSSLSQEEQDAIASQIIETIEDESEWHRKLAATPQPLRVLAGEALQEDREGKTLPIEDLL